MSSPIKETKEVKNYAVDSAEFGHILTGLVERFKLVTTIGDHVAILGKGEKYTLSDGQQIGKKELRSVRAQFSKSLLELKKYMVASKKKPKTTRAGNKNNGFTNPIVVSKEMQEFFAGASLGSLNPEDPSSGALNSALQLLVKYGISSSAILTPLFCIYTTINMLQNQDNRQQISADARMKKYFEQTFVGLAARGPKVDKKGVSRPAPTLDAFPYATFQTLIARNRVDPASWTPDQKQMVDLIKTKVDNPDVASQLEPDQINLVQQLQLSMIKEQSSASEALKFYRTKNQETLKQERTEKRKAKKPAN